MIQGSMKKQEPAQWLRYLAPSPAHGTIPRNQSLFRTAALYLSAVELAGPPCASPNTAICLCTGIHGQRTCSVVHSNPFPTAAFLQANADLATTNRVEVVTVGRRSSVGFSILNLPHHLFQLCFPAVTQSEEA